MDHLAIRRLLLSITLACVGGCGTGDGERDDAASATRSAAAEASAALTRAELATRADAFLSALQKKSDEELPNGARVTENGKAIALSASLLYGARAFPYRAFFAEPAAATLGVFGVADAGESPLIFSARVRVADGEIKEVELITARPGEASVAAPEQLKTPHPMYESIVEPAQRTSRAALIAAANGYFDAIERSDAALAPFADSCNRFENGVQTTNAVGGPSPLLSLDCRTGIPFLTYIERIRDRRYPVIDEERGLVWGLAVFDIPGGTYRQEFPNGQVVERTQPPRSILISELFKVVAGRIERIEVVMRNGPLGSIDGWTAKP